MLSIRGRISMALVRIVVKHWPKNDADALIRRARRVFGEPKLVLFRVPHGLKIEPVDADVSGEWLVPEQLRFPDSVLLYFHGGGYVSGSAKVHRPITSTLARMIGCRVFSANYRLAPEHPCPAAADDALNSYQWLLKQGIKPKNIALAGDSAGGGLVIATLVRLRDQAAPLPACAVGLSPWVDLSGDFPCTNVKSCAMFFREDGLAFAQVYLHGTSGRSTVPSPILADLHGLPPLLIQAAHSELLYDDSVRLHEKAKSSGVDSTLHIYKGLPHVWQIFAGVVPEANQALKEIAEFISQKFLVEPAGMDVAAGFRSGTSRA